MAIYKKAPVAHKPSTKGERIHFGAPQIVVPQVLTTGISATHPEIEN